MVTDRERQILGWIEENPLISQQELAKRAGITRSSVAVHISNLMRKGLIRGKGYLLQKSPYVAVVGAVNMDIFGRPAAPLIPRDSNPGQVRMSLGGVGRNIAHNLALLGTQVKLLTAFGEDMYAAQILQSCREIGIDTSHSRSVPGGATSTYLFITDEAGEMELAVSDMEIYDSLTPQYLEGKLDLLGGASAIVVDGNIPKESIDFLAENCTVPLFADPVSTAKAKKFVDALGRFHTLKPNRLEAELLSGVPITDNASLGKAAQKLLERGLRQVFISLGDRGVYCAGGKYAKLLPPYPAKVVNTTGAGDSFMAALAWAHLEGMDSEQAAKAGLAAASICIAGAGTISEAVNRESILSLIHS